MWRCKRVRCGSSGPIPRLNDGDNPRRRWATRRVQLWPQLTTHQRQCVQHDSVTHRSPTTRHYRSVCIVSSVHRTGTTRHYRSVCIVSSVHRTGQFSKSDKLWTGQLQTKMANSLDLFLAVSKGLWNVLDDQSQQSSNSFVDQSANHAPHMTLQVLIIRNCITGSL